MNLRKGMMAVTAVLCLFAAVALAEVPRQINFQGTLTDSIGNPISGTQQITFAIYPSETNPTPLWSEIQHVDMIDGLFHVQLGALTPLPPSIFSGNTLWLGIQIAPDLTELLPRQPLVTVPCSFKTAKSDTASYSLSSAPDNDWTISGNDIYHMTGNVGIGTASPAFKLDVTGNVNADSLYKIRGNTVLSVSGSQNVMVGKAANINNTGGQGTFVGDSAGCINQGWSNTFIGHKAGRANTSGYSNTFLGDNAGIKSTSAIYSTFVGENAGYHNTTGVYNTYVGAEAGGPSETGSWNTYVGTSTGTWGNGSRNVFLGYQAGYYETGSNKLYIANGANDSNVLIYGDFATKHVGIGTTNPSSGTLEVVGGSSTGIVTSSSGSNAISATSSAGGGFAAGRFVSSNPNTYGIYAQSSGYDALYAYCSSSSNAAIRAVTSGGAYAGTFSGNVGIGTLNPDVPLQIGNGTHSAMYNTSVQIDYDDNDQHQIELKNNAGAAQFGINYLGDAIMGAETSGKNLYLVTDNTPRAFIQGTTGNVGIGTTNPDVALQIGSGSHGPVTLNTAFQIDYNDNDQHGIEICNNAGSAQFGINYLGDAVLGAQTAGKNLYLGTYNRAEIFIQGSSGNIGIGTMYPSRVLHVYGATNPRILVEAPVGQAPELNLQRGPVTYAMYVNSGNDLIFYQAGDRVTFTDDGKVGIGTISPSHQLTVNVSGTDDVMRLIGPDGGALGYGARLNFGDGDYAYLDEDTDDHLDIHAGGGVALTGGEVSVQTMNATTSGSQVMWYNGKLYYYGSSERYKDDIKPLKEDFNKILDAEPVSFTDKMSGERNIGFIAEEFEKLGLENLVVHRDGEPEGVKYELVSLYLLEIIKRQDAKIEELTQRIETIETANR